MSPNAAKVDSRSRRQSRFKVYYDEAKAPQTTHWDIDYLPSAAVDQAYASSSDADESNVDESSRAGDGWQNRRNSRLNLTSKVLNILLYQSGWFAIVIGVANEHVVPGVAIATALLAVHCLLTTDLKHEVMLVTACVLVGLTVDSTLISVGAIEFSTSASLKVLPPLWLSLMWAQFGSTLNYSLRWLGGSLFIAAVFGFIGGPLAYLGGEALGAVSIQEPRSMSAIWLAGLWSLALPFLVETARRLRRGASTGLEYRMPSTLLSSGKDSRRDCS